MKSYFTPVSGNLPPASTGEARAPRGAPKAIVIGSGFGGLAAAIRLSCRGWHVEVLEKLDGPGGRAYVWKQDGFSFDAGPTIITVPHLFEELWALVGRRFHDDVQMRSLDPYYRIRFDDGRHFDYSGDAAHMRAEVARFDPADVPGFERLAECRTERQPSFRDRARKRWDRGAGRAPGAP